MKEDDEQFKLLQEELKRIAETRNTTSNPDIDNLSPIDLHSLLYNTFGEESCIGFKSEISDEVLAKIPFLELMLEYLFAIEKAKEIKLTARGNLPRKLCIELYNKGIIKEDYIESGIVKLSKEADSIVLQNLKIIADLSGLTKKRNNKLSLTQKGKKLINPQSKLVLFKELFFTNFQKFNLGFHDGYSKDVGVQQTIGYTLYLMLRYGKEKKPLGFYSNKQITAFPFELEYMDAGWTTPEEQYENCFAVRIFDRFLGHYGLVDYKHTLSFRRNEMVELKVTKIFFEIFELRKDKFKFRKTKHLA